MLAGMIVTCTAAYTGYEEWLALALSTVNEGGMCTCIDFMSSHYASIAFLSLDKVLLHTPLPL